MSDERMLQVAMEMGRWRVVEGDWTEQQLVEYARAVVRIVREQQKLYPDALPEPE